MQATQKTNGANPSQKSSLPTESTGIIRYHTKLFPAGKANIASIFRFKKTGLADLAFAFF